MEGGFLFSIGMLYILYFTVLIRLYFCSTKSLVCVELVETQKSV